MWCYLIQRSLRDACPLRDWRESIQVVSARQPVWVTKFPKHLISLVLSSVVQSFCRPGCDVISAVSARRLSSGKKWSMVSARQPVIAALPGRPPGAGGRRERRREGMRSQGGVRGGCQKDDEASAVLTRSAAVPAQTLAAASSWLWKERGLYYIKWAYILAFIGNGANLAHLFRKRAKRQKWRKSSNFWQCALLMDIIWQCILLKKCWIKGISVEQWLNWG